jgi:DNA-binding transcriptional ArsR family regulator
VNLAAPYLVVLSASEGAALAALARTTSPLSGRQVARLGGGSSSSVARALKRLVEHGLVDMQVAGAGAALLYTLNRDHLAAEPVLALLGMRRTLARRLTSA